jgi:protein CpxP
MKHITAITVLALVISGLLASPAVLAESTDAAVNAKQNPVNVAPNNYDRHERREQRLEKLKSALKLNANQEAAWTEWTTKFKGDRKSWEERRKNAESLANLPAPERMERKLAFSKEQIVKQESRLEATKTFYATLSPEQRLIFDKAFNFAHHNHFGKH